MTTLNASEAGLRGLIQRHLRKPAKTNMDRDKIDFLLVQYFALCAPAKIYHKQIELEDAAQVMKPVLGMSTPRRFTGASPSKDDVLASRISQRSRNTQDQFHRARSQGQRNRRQDVLRASSLLAFIRFNFLMRRTLIELMHADLIAIRSALTRLKRRRTPSTASPAASPSPNRRQSSPAADEWKQPFQQEYTERTVTTPSKSSSALRGDVERALERVAPKSAAPLATIAADASSRPAAQSSAAGRDAKEPAPKRSRPAFSILRRA